MKIGIVKKQNQARYCIVCGVENPFGLHAKFYNLEDGGLVGLCTADPLHQSYPGRVHGGVISALLDEAIGRVIQVSEPETWAVTTRMQVRFRKPVPYGEKLMLTSYLTKNGRRLFSAEGKLYLEDGTLAAEATGEYMKLPLSSISEMDEHGKDWMYYPDDVQPEWIDIPDDAKPMGER